jgi:hypothetical protein
VLTDGSQFQEVKVISLPERSDRRDAFAVAASVTGFDVDFVDGVDGEKVPFRPYTMDKKAGIVGSWRAHMNVLRDMVQRGVSSMLVFEDDTDWDVSLKHQLKQFARGSRFLLNQNDTDSLNSPYGEGWDLLWLGTCGTLDYPADNRRFVIPQDPTAGIWLRDYNPKPEMSPWPDSQTRIVFVPLFGVCTFAYGVSLAGARKILYHMSMQPFDDPADLGMSNMCRDKLSGFSCIAPFPTLVGIQRPAGERSSWSDIETDSQTPQVHSAAQSWNIAYSTRMNLERLLVGQDSFLPSNRFQQTLEPVKMQDIVGAVGHGEYLASP